MHIVIADDHGLILAGFSNLIQSQNWPHRLSTVENKGELMHLLKNDKIDILFQDLKFGDHDARTFIQTVQQQSPSTRIIIISTIMDVSTVNMMKQMGVHGYISKSDDSSEIIAAIKAMVAGESYWSTEINSLLRSHKTSLPTQPLLTDREREVLLLILEGKTTKQIAQTLYLSEKTIETYRSSLFIKFDVNNVASLVKKALLAGIIDNSQS